MGLFGSSKPPSPPLPNLAIQLSTPPEKIFKPDDIISGTISITPAIPITPQALEITLFGQSIIWYRTSTTNTTGPNNKRQYFHWRDNAPLFNITTNILPPSATPLQPDQTLTLPFTIPFPLRTRNKRLAQYKQDSDERWTVGPHNLPPTFTLSSTNPPTCTHPNYAKIHYGLSARLLSPEYTDVDPAALQISTPILFSPQNASLDATHSTCRYEQSHTLQTSQLAGIDKQDIGFRQAIRDRWSSSTPRLVFDTCLEVPDVLVAGQEFCIRAVVQVGSRSANVVRIPAARFRILALELVEYTVVRAPRDYNTRGAYGGWRRDGVPPTTDKAYSGREHQESGRRGVGLNCVPNEVLREFEEVRCDGEEQESSLAVLFSARIPSMTSASFRSFAISRAYRVRAKLGVEIAGRIFEQEIESAVREMGGAVV